MTYPVDTGDTPGPESTPRKPIYTDLLLLQLAAIVFLLDQFSKFLVRELLTYREAYPVEGFFRIIHSHNTGSAFGILQDQNAPLIVVSLVGITVLALIYQSQRRPSNLLRLSLGLQIGGATGNLVDRVLLGHVVDFIDVGTWPIFNLADSSIVVGLAVLAWLYLGPDRSREVKPSDTGIGALEPVVGGIQDGLYARCPLCDGEMLAAGHGWRCAICGVKERIDAAGGSPERLVAAEQRLGDEPTPMAPAGVFRTSSVPPPEAPRRGDFTINQMPKMDAEGASSPYRRDELEDDLGSSGTSKPL